MDAPKSNTFIVKILYQQNNTWQGTVNWADQRKEQHFRSALELIRLIDDAINEGKPKQEDTES